MPAYSPLPLLCKRFSPSPAARLTHHPYPPCRCFSAEKLHHYLCVISLAICVLANFKTKKEKKRKKRKERKKQEDAVEEERRYFASSLRVAWLARRGLTIWLSDLATAFCSSSLITLIITQTRLGRSAKNSHPSRQTSLFRKPRISVVLCCVFSLQYSLLFRCRFRTFVVATYQSP